MPKFYGQVKGFKFDNLQPLKEPEPTSRERRLASIFPRREYESETRYKRRLNIIDELMKNPASPKHGTRTGYNSGWRCTCDKCEEYRAAKNAITKEYLREYRASRKKNGR